MGAVEITPTSWALLEGALYNIEISNPFGLRGGFGLKIDQLDAGFFYLGATEVKVIHSVVQNGARLRFLPERSDPEQLLGSSDRFTSIAVQYAVGPIGREDFTNLTLREVNLRLRAVGPIACGCADAQVVESFREIARYEFYRDYLDSENCGEVEKAVLASRLAGGAPFGADDAFGAKYELLVKVVQRFEGRRKRYLDRQIEQAVGRMYDHWRESERLATIVGSS